MVMRTLHQHPFHTDTYEKIAETVLHYGFRPIKTPRLSREDIALSKEFAYLHIKDPLEEKISLMRMFITHKLHERDHPQLFYYARPSRSKKSEYRFSLDILGTDDSIADALLIQATRASLESEGFKDIVVHINSMGEKDTMTRFEKELGNHFRKYVADLPPKWQSAFKQDMFEITRCTDEVCDIFTNTAPKIVNFLSEPARKHFAHVLEYLESAQIPYVIDYNLFANKHIATHTVFEIHDAQSDATLARGFRYGKISKKIGLKQDIPGASAFVSYEHPKPKTTSVLAYNKAPLFYFVHLGPHARLKGLSILELLRQARVRVLHGLTREKISGQMEIAEKSGAKYAIIMGQKEAYENSVLIRNLSTWKQDSVPICDLPHIIKKYT